MTDQNRAQNGQYMNKLEAVCKCGHENGDHDAERARVNGVMRQPCQHSGCSCECFSKPRKSFRKA